MKAIIKPSVLKGTVEIPSSKSLTHRALICASLARGTSLIENPLICDDTLATINGLKQMSMDIQKEGKNLKVTGNNGIFKKKKEVISVNCQDSGTTLRFLISLADLSGNHVILDGTRRLRERPVGSLVLALNRLGADIICNRDDFAPVEIRPAKISGGMVELDGTLSSQFISSLLLISPLLDKKLIVNDDLTVSRPYMDLTVDMMRKFGTNGNRSGYQANDIKIEGDWSNASFFYILKEISESDINITGINGESLQGDRIIMEIIQTMNKKGKNYREIDLADFPDLMPTVAILAIFTTGKTRIKNIGHLKHKESDRIQTVGENLEQMGISNMIGKDFLEIEGGKPHGAIINTYKDHRIAMAFSIAALKAEGETVIDNAGCVNKSYPDFFKDLIKLGAEISLI